MINKRGKMPEKSKIKIKNKRGMNKKAQITIFIILAIVVAAAIILSFIFWKDIKGVFVKTENPEEYMKDCISSDFEKVKEITGKQGGSIKPVNYVMYNNMNIEYICYTSEYYKTCVNQQPLLKQHVENEIKNYLKGKVSSCIDNMKNDFESQGKTVAMKGKDFNIEIVPEKIKITIDGLSIKQDEASQTFDKLEINEKSSFYELIMISTSIINWEARYGDAESTVYMTYYPNIKVEKKLQGDGTTIYLLMHRQTQEEFNFASRSVAWPAGYGFGEV